jgi:hypothetical protein
MSSHGHNTRKKASRGAPAAAPTSRGRSKSRAASSGVCRQSAAGGRPQQPQHDSGSEQELSASQKSATISDDENDGTFKPDQQQQREERKQDDDDDAELEDDFGAGAAQAVKPVRPAKAAAKGVRKAGASMLERTKARRDMLLAEAAAKAADADCYERKSKAKIEERKQMLELEEKELSLRKLKDRHAADAKLNQADALAEREKIVGDARAAAEQHRLEARQATKEAIKMAEAAAKTVNRNKRVGDPAGAYAASLFPGRYAGSTANKWRSSSSRRSESQYRDPRAPMSRSSNRRGRSFSRSPSPDWPHDEYGSYGSASRWRSKQRSSRSPSLYRSRSQRYDSSSRSRSQRYNSPSTSPHRNRSRSVQRTSSRSPSRGNSQRGSASTSSSVRSARERLGTVWRNGGGAETLAARMNADGSDSFEPALYNETDTALCDAALNANDVD